MRREVAVFGWLIPLTLSSLCACSGTTRLWLRSAKRFPIGIYDVTDPKLVLALRKIGFDSVETGIQNPAFLKALAEEARKQRMTLLIFPDQLQRNSVSEVSGWPIEAWYLQDEPDVHNTPVGHLEGMSRETRSWDGVHSQLIVLGQGGAAERYGHAADIVMLDWYPVPHLPLASVADEIDLARRYLPNGKTIWMVIQAFDWRDFRQRLPDNKRIGRFPTYGEIRFMTYLSIVHGASGIFYYTLKKPEGTLFDVPEHLSVLSRVVRELHEMQPVFEMGVPVSLPFAIKGKDLEAAAWRFRSKTYIVLLNRNGDSKVRLPDPILKGGWHTLFGLSDDTKEPTTGDDGLSWVSPNGVRVVVDR